jgi:phospho-N-acetylmuramoyl-pentapeptide-transferase
MRDPALVLALTGFSFMLTVIWGEPFLRVLHYLNVGALIRVDGPERHFKKQGTPTMGGWLFVLPVVLITFLLNAVTLIGQTFLGRSIFLPVGTMLVCFLGAIDDWRNCGTVVKGCGQNKFC